MVSIPELLFRPGVDRLAHLGGLHAMMGWEGPIVTTWERWPELDFDEQRHRRERAQVRPRLSQQGWILTSHVDGSSLTITPEEAVTIQERMGADVAACLDPELAQVPGRLRPEVPDLTQAWAQRALDARSGPDLLLFGRAMSPGADGGEFDGYILHANDRFLLESAGEALPSDAPRLLTEGGPLIDCMKAIMAGVDLVACTQPLIDARRGVLYTRKGVVDAADVALRRVFEPVDADCSCECCTTFTRAYVHHLFVAEELLGYRLAAIHNLNFAHGWIAQIRGWIRERRIP